MQEKRGGKSEPRDSQSRQALLQERTRQRKNKPQKTGEKVEKEPESLKRKAVEPIAQDSIQFNKIDFGGQKKKAKVDPKIALKQLNEQNLKLKSMDTEKVIHVYALIRYLTSKGGRVERIAKVEKAF